MVLFRGRCRRGCDATLVPAGPGLSASCTHLGVSRRTVMPRDRAIETILSFSASGNRRWICAFSPTSVTGSTSRVDAAIHTFNLAAPAPHTGNG